MSAAAVSPADWRRGWMRRARRCPSPNFGARPSGLTIDLVVVHSISLPPGRYGGDEIERLFLNRLGPDEHPYFRDIAGRRVSSHLLIRRDGELVQFVSCDARAWHAGPSAWQGRSDCNDFSIGIELEGLEGSTFEDAQYGTLVTSIEALLLRYPIGAVAGHEHVAPGRKFDPGPGFDWRRLRDGCAGLPIRVAHPLPEGLEQALDLGHAAPIRPPQGHP